jgi:hypothetical protein
MAIASMSSVTTQYCPLAFFEGSWTYNFANLAIAIIGFVLTLVGLYLTWVQARQARKAADAARYAATVTAAGFHGLAAVVNFFELKSWADAIMAYIENGDFAPAELRLRDLYAGLVRASQAADAVNLLSADGWEKQIAMANDILDMVSKFRYELIEEFPLPEFKKCMMDLTVGLNAVAARATKKAEPQAEK